MATVFAGGLRPSAGAGRMKAALARVSVLSLAQNMLSHSKTAPTSWFSRDGGGGSVVLCKAGYGARPTFIACLLYFPRYSAACMAMMRPELLAQEACEPGARETS